MTLWHIVFPNSIPGGLSLHRWSLSEACITLVFEKWLFSSSFSTSVSWHSFKSFPFLSLPPFFVFCFCCCWTMNSCIHIYLLCYNQWVILSDVQNDYLLCLFDMSPSFIMCFLLCGTARCPGLTCIFPSLALESAVSRSLVSFRDSGIYLETKMCWVCAL